MNGRYRMPSAFIGAVSALAITVSGAAYAQSAQEFTPGQTETPMASAPGQKAKQTGKPAMQFAPGQLKKAEMDEDEDCTAEAGCLDDD